MIYISNRRELMADDFLIDSDENEVPLVTPAPIRKEAVFVHDAPWETHGGLFHNIVRRPDGGYNMYYKATHYGLKPDGCIGMIRRTCVIQSDDGLHWSRPELVITPLPGMADKTNVISGIHDYYEAIYFFYDTNPDCPEDERYKGVYGEWALGLFLYTSADGIHFRFHPEEGKDVARPAPFGKFPPIGDPRRISTLLMSTEESHCYFDTLNIIRWDPDKNKYVALVRGFHVGDEQFPLDPDVPEAVRDIRYAESEDLVHWTTPVQVLYNDGYDYQMYTSCALVYYRAPHMMIGPPTRYTARAEWNDSFDRLCGAEDRKSRGRGKSLTDAIFASSRDGGKSWFRTGQAIYTPGPEQDVNWRYGDCYPCLGMIETPSDMPGCDPVLSVFCEVNRLGYPATLFRYEWRIDGFACRRSTFAPQRLVTKPFVYNGRELEVNFATSAAGYIRFTLECEDGRAIHSSEVFGDKIDRIVGFDDGSPADFAGKPVRMICEMSDASLYSFKFN